MLRLNVTGAEAVQRELNELFGAIRPGGKLGKVLGRAAGSVLKTHFRERNRRPNKLGGKRTNFWSAVASSVSRPRLLRAAIEIDITHPAIGQKVHGGPIRPKVGTSYQGRQVQHLTVPVSAKSHGRSARTFPLLAWLPPKRGARAGTGGYLVEGQRHKLTRGPRKGREVVVPKPGGSLLYVLRQWVDQAADPRALPSAAEFIEPLIRAGRQYLSRPRR